LILPVFAFANAGLYLLGASSDALFNSVTLCIAAGLFLGKQFGIFAACWLVIKLGLTKMPEKTTWTQLYGVSLLCGIGFTMSLFIGSLAFENQDVSYLNSVKIGVLAGSLLSAFLGAVVILRMPKA
jgi:Na+:H+ antiporter, NhaA family